MSLISEIDPRQRGSKDLESGPKTEQYQYDTEQTKDHGTRNQENGSKMAQKLKSREWAKDSVELRVQRVEKSQRESFAGNTGAESSYMTWQRVVLWISELPRTCGLCLFLLFLFFPGRVYSSLDVPALLLQVGVNTTPIVPQAF